MKSPAGEHGKSGGAARLRCAALAGRRGARAAAAALAAVAALVAVGCSAGYYTQDADREVYGIVADKREAAFGRASPFTVEPSRVIEEIFGRRGGPAAAGGEAAAGGGAEQAVEAEPGVKAEPGPAEGEAAAEEEMPSPLPEVGPEAVRLSVADAMRLAVLANRDYQSEKEGVYLAALALTVERYLFRPHPVATGTVSTDNNERTRVRTWDGAAEVGFSQRLADGAAVVGSLGLTALKYINKELGDTLDSTLSFSLRQPLWRGAGRKIVQENLVQAERNALYAVRSFARYEQTFAVRVATEYLRVLEQRQVVLNEWQNYRSLKDGRERAASLAQADRLPEFQVDQARQDELRAYNRWILAREAYVNTLDAFKVLLGVPVAAAIELDPGELDKLTAEGLKDPGVGPEDAVGQALEARLDLRNTRDGLQDAERKIRVAEDGLKGDVDLVASIGYSSDPARSPESARLAFHQGLYSVGLDIDLPIDRLQERNALRRTQIDRDRATRALALLEDQVTRQVREAHRKLLQTRQSYEIQRLSVELAARRVESTDLLLQAGRATQRDVLEAQRALVDAQNALAGALVDHTVAGLELQRDVGTLTVDQEGQIHGWILSRGGP